jgi:hypothetical protein
VKVVSLIGRVYKTMFMRLVRTHWPEGFLLLILVLPNEVTRTV